MRWSFQSSCGLFRSSRPEVFLGKGVLKICSKFTGEHSAEVLCNFIEISLVIEISQNSALVKETSLRPATLLKRDSGTGVFL